MRVAILLTSLVLSGCSVLIGNHPFSTLPKSDFGSPERAKLLVSVTPHPWAVVVPRESGTVDMVIFVHVRGRGWEQRGVRLEAEFPGMTYRTAAGCRQWTLKLDKLKPGYHGVTIRAVASNGETLHSSDHAWTVWDWDTVQRMLELETW